MGVRHPHQVGALVNIDLWEVGSDELLITAGRTHMVAAIAVHEESGDGVLTVDPTWVDGDQAAAGNQHPPGQLGHLPDLGVVEMVQHPSGDHDVELTIVHEVVDTGHDESAPLLELVARGIDVGGIRIEAHIGDVAK